MVSFLGLSEEGERKLEVIGGLLYLNLLVDYLKIIKMDFSNYDPNDALHKKLLVNIGNNLLKDYWTYKKLEEVFDKETVDQVTEDLTKINENELVETINKLLGIMKDEPIKYENILAKSLEAYIKAGSEAGIKKVKKIAIKDGNYEFIKNSPFELSKKEFIKIGKVCLKKGDLTHAEEAYTRTRYIKGLTKIGNVHRDKHSLEEAVRCYKKAEELQKS